MRFDLNDDQELVRDTARRFLEAEAPLAELRKHYDSPEPFARKVWSKACELGWPALAAPESVGGFSISGNPGQDLAIIAEEIGRLAAPGFLVPTAVALQALADSAHIETLGPGLLSGESLVGWAFGEPGNRWDPATFATRVERAGDDVVLNGTKAYVEGGAGAEAFIVVAHGPDGLTQVLVPANGAGVTVKAGRSLDFVRRFAEVRLDDVRLPASAVLGEVGGAAAAVERQLQLALLLQCAETNGGLERTFEFTVDYMRERYAFGRPIASYQALKHRLADLLVQLQSCMATTDAALDAYDAGSEDAGRLARVAKTFVAGRSMKILGDLVQLTGGIGVTWEHDLHIYERRAAVNRAVFGSPEEHRARLHQLITA